ncbi:hypothetical protein IJT93_04515 [bacterium]|nr:hypothetical protein [bacterium]
MNSFDLNFWLSESVEQTLDRLNSADINKENELKILKQLRAAFPPEQAGEILTQAKLRRKAAVKFPLAHKMFFEAEALEQATSWELALHRAEKLHRLAPAGIFLDLGCSIGGDALALAQFRPVTAIDLNPVRLQILKANCLKTQSPFTVTILQGDYLEMNLPEAGAVFIDPARRQDGKRIFSIDKIQPPLAELLKLSDRLKLPAAVKLAPSLDKGLLNEYPAAALEFTGRSKQCQEAVLWLNTDNSLPRLQGSVLSREGKWLERAGTPEEEQHLQTGPLLADQYIYEIEPAMLRAGALENIAGEIGAHLFDPQVSWLISDKLCRHPLAESFHIETAEKFSLKKLQKYLSERQIGILEIKKRNSAVEPETLRKQLKLARSKKEATVFITRRNGVPMMILAYRI